jgi:translation initiation factor IF-3
LRTNRRIRVPEVRLIGADGEQLGMFITSEAIKKAEAEGLDLVEISPMAKPPVCKIMDYGKHKYEESKKKQKAKKQQVVVHVKEIKMRPSTDEHDLQVKMKHVKRFLEEGDRVKISIRFRGREMAHKELGRNRMEWVAGELKEMAEVTQMPKMEGRVMHMMLQPLKKKA